MAGRAETRKAAAVPDARTNAGVEQDAAARLAAVVRELVDATVRTEIDPAEVDDVRADLEALVERLRQRQLPGSFGAAHGWESGRRHWGNAVIGPRNAIAPPLAMVRERGRVWSEFSLGAAYEGPPTFVHGGVSALVLDQVLGEAAASSGHPGMTGTLSLRYRRPTPLGRLRAEAEMTRVEGIKTFVEGRIQVPGPDGSWVTSVEAEGVFILPRWARERLAERERANEAGDSSFFEV